MLVFHCKYNCGQQLLHDVLPFPLISPVNVLGTGMCEGWLTLAESRRSAYVDGCTDMKRSCPTELGENLSVLLLLAPTLTTRKVDLSGFQLAKQHNNVLLCANASDGMTSDSKKGPHLDQRK